MDRRDQTYSGFISRVLSTNSHLGAPGGGGGDNANAKKDADDTYTFDAFDVNIESPKLSAKKDEQQQSQEQEYGDGKSTRIDYPVELIAAIMAPPTRQETKADSKQDDSVNERRMIFLHRQVQPEYLKQPNRVSNTKYNALSFVPLCFVSQLMTPLGAFFVISALLQIIPPFRIGPLLGYLFPPIFCLVATIAVEGLGEIRRKQRDKEENGTPVRVLRDGKVTNTTSGELTIGDIVVLEDGEAATFNGIALAPFRQTEQNDQTPDHLRQKELLVLSGEEGRDAVQVGEAEEKGKETETEATKQKESKQVNFYIRTDQLDGETDWKHRKCVLNSQMYSSNIEDIDAVLVLDDYSTSTSHPCASTGRIGHCVIFEGQHSEGAAESCHVISNECVIPCGVVLQSPEPILVLMAGCSSMCPRPNSSTKRFSISKIKAAFGRKGAASLRVDLSDRNINRCSGFVFGLIILVFSLPMCIMDCLYNGTKGSNGELSTGVGAMVSWICCIMIYSVCLPASLPVFMKVARAVNNGGSELGEGIKKLFRGKTAKANRVAIDISTENECGSGKSKRSARPMPKLRTQDDCTKGTSVVSLGRIGCMLSDKTGTLTANEMHLFGYQKMERGEVVEAEEPCDNNNVNTNTRDGVNGAIAVGLNTGIGALHKLIPKPVLGLLAPNQQEVRFEERTEIDDVIKGNGSVATGKDVVNRNICSGAGICLVRGGIASPILNPREQMRKSGRTQANNEENSNHNVLEGETDSCGEAKNTKRSGVKSISSKRGNKRLTFRGCVKEFLLCNSVYVDGEDWNSAQHLPSTAPVFRASSAEEVALAEFCYMNTSTTIARREERDVEIPIAEGMNTMTVPCILTFEWPTNCHSLSNTNTLTVREYAVLHTIPFNSTLKRMSVIVQRIKKFDVNTDNEDDLEALWDTSKRPYNYGRIRAITKGADCAVIPLLARRASSDIHGGEEQSGNKTPPPLSASALMQVSNTYACGGLRTLAFCERTLREGEFVNVFGLIKAANNSTHSQEILRKVNEIIPYESTASCVIGIEDKLQKGVQESIINLRSAGIPVWMLTGDKVETALSVASQCGIIADANHTFVFEEDKTGVDPLLTLAQKVNSPRRNTCGTTTVCATSSDIAALQREHLLQRFVVLLMKADGAVLCRLTPEQKELVTKTVGEELRKVDMAVCAIGDGGNDVKMIKEAEVGIGIVGKEGRMAALASDVVVSSFESAHKCVLVAGYSAYYRYGTMWKLMISRGVRLGFIYMFMIAASHFVPLCPISGMTSIFYSTLYTGIPLIQIVWDYSNSINIKSLLNKLPKFKTSRKLPFYTSARTKNQVRPLVYREQSSQTIISLNTLIGMVIVSLVQSIVIFAVMFGIYGPKGLSAIVFTLVCCCIWDCIECAEKKSAILLVSSGLSILFTLLILMFADKGMPATMSFVQFCISILLVFGVCLPLTFLRKRGKSLGRGNNNNRNRSNTISGGTNNTANNNNDNNFGNFKNSNVGDNEKKL